MGGEPTFAGAIANGEIVSFGDKRQMCRVPTGFCPRR
jgi:hypothetical protein